MENTNYKLVERNLSEYLSSSNPIGAQGDVDVVKAWIEYACSNSTNTLNSYLKEIKRLLIYCDSISKHFTKLGALQINEYLSILLNPNDQWLKPLNNIVEPLKTQILLKPLCMKSVDYSQRVLNSFYTYLVDAGVIHSNPVKLSVKLKVESVYDENGAEKALSLDAWLYLSQWVKHQSQDSKVKNRSKSVRDRWLLHFLYYTGARKSSLVNLSMSSFMLEQSNNQRVWIVAFKAKGNKIHKVIANDQLLDELRFYRSCIGLPEMPNPSEIDIPVVPAITKGTLSGFQAKSPISSRGINWAIEQSLEQAASDCEDYFIAEELKNATPHTFRHTCATHQLYYKSDVVSTQKHLGHSNINTTMGYIHKSFEQRVAASRELSEAYGRDSTD